MPTDPNKLLDRVLRLIDIDTKRIKKATRGCQQLKPADAQTLCRYASTIASIKEEKEAENLKEKRRLERMSTEELIAEFQRQQKGKS